MRRGILGEKPAPSLPAIGVWGALYATFIANNHTANFLAYCTLRLFINLHNLLNINIFECVILVGLILYLLKSLLIPHLTSLYLLYFANSG